MELINRLKAAIRYDATQRAAAPSAGDAAMLDRPWAQTYDPAASKADILHCFRLLLGRNPNPEEWVGHTMHVGEPLADVVASYLNSLEFSRRGLTLAAPDDIVLTDLPGFRIFSERDDGAVGKYVRAGDYEQNVTAIFHALLRPGMGVLDIGANIGYFSLLSAVAVTATGHVLAIEPNQQNAKLLEASRRLNGFANITLLPLAAGAQTGSLALHTSHSTGTTSALPAEIASLLATRIVPCVALDTIVPPDRRIDLIKIDVDGAEYPAMRGCETIIRRDRPAIISEFAPALMPGISGVSGIDYLNWFAALNYRIAVIEPDGSLAPAGQDWDKIMQIYRKRGTDHIDILAEPIAQTPR